MSPKVVGRFMFVLGYLILFSLFSYQALARELTVFAIQKNLQMSIKDPVYHDYYLDGGTEAGISRGQIITVVRRIPLHDLTRNRPLGDMHMPVAQLKVLYVQRGSSVARLHKLFLDKDRPLIDFNAVMVGDQVSNGTDGEGEAQESEAAPAPQPAPVPKKDLPKGSGEKAEAVIPLPEKIAPEISAPPKPAEPSNAPKT
ncbi:MAG: hypothetical protein ABL958_07125 [Bdellovibrionia bacterium]